MEAERVGDFLHGARSLQHPPGGQEALLIQPGLRGAPEDGREDALQVARRDAQGPGQTTTAISELRCQVAQPLDIGLDVLFQPSTPQLTGELGRPIANRLRGQRPIADAVAGASPAGEC